MLGEGDLYQQNSQLLDRGFLVKYSQSTLENDFNMISRWLFTRRTQLKKIADKHLKIKNKVELTVKFYGQLGIHLDMK